MGQEENVNLCWGSADALEHTHCKFRAGVRRVQRLLSGLVLYGEDPVLIFLNAETKHLTEQLEEERKNLFGFGV